MLTVIDCKVEPVDHKFPVAEEEVSITFPPVQKVVALPAVIVGVAGVAFTMTRLLEVTVFDPEPFCAVKATVYVPGVL